MNRKEEKTEDSFIDKLMLWSWMTLFGIGAVSGIASILGMLAFVLYAFFLALAG